MKKLTYLHCRNQTPQLLEDGENLLNSLESCVLCVGPGLHPNDPKCPNVTFLPDKLGVLEPRCDDCFRKHIALLRAKRRKSDRST